MKGLVCGLIGIFLIACSDNYPPPVPLYRYGILQPIGQESEGKSASSITGDVAYFKDYELIEETSSIPLTQGVVFGIEYYLPASKYEKGTDVREVITFPEQGLKNPDTGLVGYYYEYDRSKPATGRILTLAWGFTETWELVPGIWEYKVYINNDLVIVHEFNVR